MSLVNLAGERIFLQPKTERVTPVRSPAIRKRNLSWLRIQRTLGYSLAQMVELLGKPRSTVDSALRWAAVEVERLEEEAIAAERATILDPKSGLDVDDVVYLINEYPPGSELGSIPVFREFLGKMLQRIEALGYDVRPLSVALTGAA